VTCVKCRRRFCFRHRVEWHETITCAEYDRFQANPQGFRSQFELENERAERERAAEAKRRREQEDSDQRLAQSLLAEDQREAARRQAERERQVRVQRERQEQALREAERQEAEEARRRMLQEAERKRTQELANLQTISRTTKNCPSCKWPIEKNQGWWVSLKCHLRSGVR
jgi:hypothetical protein